MEMIIYEKPKYIQVVYHPDKNIIVFDWTDFLVTLQEIQELHEKALKIAQENGCYYYVAETSKVTNMLRPEVIKWWADIWVPKMVSAGLKAIVTVVPSSAIAAFSTHGWQAQVLDGITMANVRSFADAERLIKEMQSKK
jgi:alkylhydroperoxidase family enzyme